MPRRVEQRGDRRGDFPREVSDHRLFDVNGDGVGVDGVGGLAPEPRGYRHELFPAVVEPRVVLERRLPDRFAAHHVGRRLPPPPGVLLKPVGGAVGGQNRGVARADGQLADFGGDVELVPHDLFVAGA